VKKVSGMCKKLGVHHHKVFSYLVWGENEENEGKQIPNTFTWHNEVVLGTDPFNRQFKYCEGIVKQGKNQGRSYHCYKEPNNNWAILLGTFVFEDEEKEIFQLPLQEIEDTEEYETEEEQEESFST
jgi:hypothetical protein